MGLPGMMVKSKGSDLLYASNKEFKENMMRQLSVSACILSAVLLVSGAGAQANVAAASAPLVSGSALAAPAAKPAEAVSGAVAPKVLKVIFHVNEQDKLDMTLGNISNLLKNLPDGYGSANVEVVLNGTAPNRVDVTKPELQTFAQYGKAAYKWVMGLISSEQKPSEPTLQIMDRMSQKSNVHFVVCGNSLDNLKINRANVPPFMKIVPAGVAELALRGNEGFAYQKP